MTVLENGQVAGSGDVDDKSFDKSEFRDQMTCVIVDQQSETITSMKNGGM